MHDTPLPPTDILACCRHDILTSTNTRLPVATVQKIISEVLTTNPALKDPNSNLTFAKETRDVLIECCVEFITMLSSEANEIAEKDAKKTIACEHITKALEELGFGEYVPELQRVAEEFRSAAAVSYTTSSSFCVCVWKQGRCVDSRCCSIGSGNRRRLNRVA